METQLNTYSKINDASGIQMLGNAIAASGMFGCNKEEQGVIIALQCMAENMPPLEMAKTYHLIQGKLTKRSDAMLADFRKAGGKFIFDDLKNPTVQKAVVNFEDYKDFKVEYSIDDAKSAGVYQTKKESAWQKTPAAMLRARLVSETLRAIAPEIVTGVYTPEEAAQFSDPIEVTKPAEKATQSKPVSKKPIQEAKKIVEESPIDLEIVDEPIESDPLEKLIKENNAEACINDYFIGKALIDTKQTWRDLDQETQAQMLADFDALHAAARKAQG